jgi:hypothetical protein
MLKELTLVIQPHTRDNGADQRQCEQHQTRDDEE